MPRRSLVTTPASRRTLRWWLIVGWLTVQHSLKSQAQTQSVLGQLAHEREPDGVGQGRQESDVGIERLHLRGSISTAIHIDNGRYSVGAQTAEGR